MTSCVQATLVTQLPKQKTRDTVSIPFRLTIQNERFLF
jgi:hypothetical protein